MSIDISVLQKFVDGEGRCFLCQRRTSWTTDLSAWIICPTIPDEIRNKKVDELPYFVVHNFARSNAISNIPLGKMYAPFQHGIRYEDFGFAEEITCNIMDFVIHCHSNNITDYVEATKVMKQMTEDEKPL